MSGAFAHRFDGYHLRHRRHVLRDKLFSLLRTRQRFCPLVESSYGISLSRGNRLCVRLEGLALRLEALSYFRFELKSVEKALLEALICKLQILLDLVEADLFG